MYSCACDPDDGRHNLMAQHRPRGAGGRSVLFNGHIDVVPTGPESLWTKPPFEPWVDDGWLYGRGSGDMKGGLVCVLAALLALRRIGWQPAGLVGFNAVLDEENTGNGTLATVHALTHSMDGIKLDDFDAVIIPEPFGETLMTAQVGVCWLFVELTGRPAHVAYMHQGVNPIEAAIAIMADLKELEAAWNAPEVRHPAFAGVEHPINFNLGRIEGGEWNSSVPCTCTMGLRFGFFPGTPAADARRVVTERIVATATRLNPALTVNVDLARLLRARLRVRPRGAGDAGPRPRARARQRHAAVASRVHGHHRRPSLRADDRHPGHRLRTRGPQHPRHRRGRVAAQHAARRHDVGAVHRRLVRRRIHRRKARMTRDNERIARPPAVPTVQIDNDRVKVTEWRFAPGAETGWHRHVMDYVVVPGTTGTLLLDTPDGAVRSPLVAGVSYTRSIGVEHNVINDNDHAFVFVEIELK